MQSSDIPKQVRDAAARLTPSPVLAIEELRKGANSRVFRVKTADGEFALKKYPTHRQPRPAGRGGACAVVF